MTHHSPACIRQPPPWTCAVFSDILRACVRDVFCVEGPKKTGQREKLGANETTIVSWTPRLPWLTRAVAAATADGEKLFGTDRQLRHTRQHHDNNTINARHGSRIAAGKRTEEKNDDEQKKKIKPGKRKRKQTAIVEYYDCCWAAVRDNNGMRKREQRW